MALTKGAYTLSDMRKRAGTNGLRVLSTFSGGGGSSIGYKLAGFDVVGGVEIDPEMADLYEKNLKPKFLFRMPVGDFVKLPDSEIPNDLKGLDILDGSPPCSTFSMAGSREDKWGKNTHFREGQTAQVLDSLFMDYLNLVGKLRPKIAVAENVKGMIQGEAKGYALEVLERFREMGYEPQLFLLNSSRMGVPQTRERVFFIARRADLKLPKLRLKFNERPITAGEATKGLDPKEQKGKDPGPAYRNAWHMTRSGKTLDEGHPRGQLFTNRKSAKNLPFFTIVATPSNLHWNEPRFLSHMEVVRAQTFPDDYDFGKVGATYVCGMSVPPLMIERLSGAIKEQCFGRHPVST